jgi:hypothetical protein
MVKRVVLLLGVHSGLARMPALAGVLDQGHVLFPGVRLPHRLPQIVIDDLAATGLVQARHQAVLQLRVPPAAALDDADPELAQDVRERKDLGFLGPEGRNMDALGIVMAPIFRHGQPQGPGLQARADNPAHGRDLLRRGSTPLALVAHDIIAHGRMANEVPDIHPEPLVEGVHILPDRFPGHGDRVEHLHRNGFDIGEKLGQAGLAATAHRRQSEGTIPNDDRGGAVIAGEGAQRVPGDLRIIVAVIIDEPGGDDKAIGINGTGCGVPEFAERDNFAVADGDVTTEGRDPGAVDDSAVFDQEIIRHRLFLLALCRWAVGQCVT